MARWSGGGKAPRNGLKCFSSFPLASVAVDAMRDLNAFALDGVQQCARLLLSVRTNRGPGLRAQTYLG